MTERWLPVVGFPGYEVSNHGRFRRATSSRKFAAGTVFKGNVQKNGYLATTLSLGTIESRKRAYIHHLVADAFLGPRPAAPAALGEDSARRRIFLTSSQYFTPG